MEQERKIRNNVFAFLLNVFCPGVVFLTDYFCTLTKSEKETGAYSSFSREKTLKQYLHRNRAWKTNFGFRERTEED